MKNMFNQGVNRKNTGAIKWDMQPKETDLPFWIADSDYSTAPCVTKALQEAALSGAFGYNAVPIRFNQAVVNWYQKRYDVSIEESWVIPTSGVILEIRVLLDLLTKEGDGVILQTPVYHTFHHVINNNNRKIIENKLIKQDDTYVMDYENLEELFKLGHKVMILCSPHNPVGRIWSREEIRKVIEIAKKYNAFVIADEIHSDLNITDHKFNSAANYLTEYENLAICNAPSKAFNIAGLHSAYVIIKNEELKEKYNELCHRQFLNSPSIFGYVATIAAYESGEEWIIEQNKHLKKNYEYLLEYLNKELPSLVVTKLEGSYLVWLDLSYTKLTTEEILKLCSDNGIICSGGSQFCSEYESYLRFNIACPFEQLKEGLNRLVKAFK